MTLEEKMAYELSKANRTKKIGGKAQDFDLLKFADALRMEYQLDGSAKLDRIADLIVKDFLAHTKAAK